MKKSQSYFSLFVLSCLLSVVALSVSFCYAEDVESPVSKSIKQIPKADLDLEIKARAEHVTNIKKSADGIQRLKHSDHGASAPIPNPPTGITMDGVHYVWVQGSLHTRSDMFYRSVEIKTLVWVTNGEKADDPKVTVNLLEASFSEVCDGKISQNWKDTDSAGFTFLRKQKGPPSIGFCFPQDVCWEGCATEGGIRWCARTKAC